MSRNLRFLAARRRGIQRREGDIFRTQLASVIPGAQYANFMEPMLSLTFEAELEERVVLGVQDGSVLRQDGLTEPALVAAWRHFLTLDCLCAVDELVLMLSGQPDFIVTIPSEYLRDVDIVQLVEVDGDTVYLTTHEQKVGFAVDLHHGLNSQVAVYEVDAWGGGAAQEVLDAARQALISDQVQPPRPRK